MNKLKEMREKNNFTHQYMATLLGISKPYYWQIENNKRGLSYQMALKIARLFSLKPDDLFYDQFKNLN